MLHVFFWGVFSQRHLEAQRLFVIGHHTVCRDPPVLVLLVLLLLESRGAEPLTGQSRLHVLDLPPPQFAEGRADQASLVQVRGAVQLETDQKDKGISETRVHKQRPFQWIQKEARVPSKAENKRQQKFLHLNLCIRGCKAVGVAHTLNKSQENGHSFVCKDQSSCLIS